MRLKLLSSIGISVLLFVVGLKLDVGLIRSVGPVALATGLGQIVFTALFGFLLSLALGFAPVKAIYIAVCLTFSSTIIIVKLLSDKREIDSLHGRIAVGFLVVQDIAVILAMILLTSFNRSQGGGGIVGPGDPAAAGGHSLCAGHRCHDALGDAAAAGPLGPEPGTAGAVRRGLGGGAGGPGRWREVQQGGRSLPGRCVDRLYGLPRGDRLTADRPARFSAAVLLHRSGLQASTSRPQACSSGPPWCCRSSCWWAIH